MPLSRDDIAAAIAGALPTNGNRQITAGILRDFLADLTAGFPVSSDLGFVWASDFGAVGDGTTDDTDALQAALDSGLSVRLAAATYRVTAPLILLGGKRRLFGSGLDTVLQYEGEGYALQVNVGDDDISTKTYVEVADLTVEGNEQSGGLYAWDVARCRFENLALTGHGLHGALLEMAISCRLTHLHASDNGGDGLRIANGVKADVQFSSNQNAVLGGTFLSNVGAGVRIHRSNGNVLHGIDATGNEDGVVIAGGARNVIDGAWIENNDTDALRIEQDTDPTTFNADRNRLVNSLTSGTGAVQILNGTANYLAGNYISGALTVSGGSATPSTIIAEQAAILGALTDGGNATIYRHSPADMYWKASGAKRLQIKVGTTVDITSDIVALRLAAVKGLSGTTTTANNLGGSVTLASGTASVTFGTAETNTSYRIVLSGNAGETFSWASKATGGFTINSSNASSTATVDWLIYR
jgi:hypothetical protein